MTTEWHKYMAEADEMLALLARMNGPGTTTWLREVRGGNVVYDGPVRALGRFPARCGTCGRPPGHPSVPCAACPDASRLIDELAARHRAARANVPAERVKPPPDPAREIERYLALPLGASLADLRAAVPDQPPGMCRECRAVPSGSPGSLCAWCAELAALLTGEKARKARPRTRNAGGALLIAAGLALLLTSTLLPPAVTVAAAVLFTVLVWRLKI